MTGRTYALSPRDRTGVLLGMTGMQTALLGVALVTFIVLVRVAAAPAIAGGLVIAAGALRLGEHTLVELIPVVLRRGWRCVRPSRPWLATLPLVEGETPAALRGQQILSVTAASAQPGRRVPVGVVHDRRGRRLAATVRARGQSFTLLDRADQDRQLQGWADALAPFAAVGSPVLAVRWVAWTGPATTQDHAAWLAERAPIDLDAAVGYEQLLAATEPALADHDVLITVVVSDRSVAGRGDLTPAIDTLLGETRRLSERLAAAGLIADGPLSPDELREVTRVRLDPASRAALARRARTLGERAGVVSAPNAAPLAAATAWKQWTCDDTVHRAFYVAEWPRTPVGADWLHGLLLHAGIVRMVAVTYEPVPQAQSRRRIERQVTKLSTDAEQRQRSGLRVNAEHQRATQAVLDREQELVAGHTEFTYVGVVDVCAGSVEDLDRAAAELVQVAAAAGLELRPLHGRHDAAVATCLPLARTVGSRGLLS